MADCESLCNLPLNSCSWAQYLFACWWSSSDLATCTSQEKHCSMQPCMSSGRRTGLAGGALRHLCTKCAKLCESVRLVTLQRVGHGGG